MKFHSAQQDLTPSQPNYTKSYVFLFPSPTFYVQETISTNLNVAWTDPPVLIKVHAISFLSYLSQWKKKSRQIQCHYYVNLNIYHIFIENPPNTFWSISYILINIPLPEFLKSDPCSKDILIALSVHTTICCATFYSMKELSVDKPHENSDIAIKGGNMDQIAL